MEEIMNEIAQEVEEYEPSLVEAEATDATIDEDEYISPHHTKKGSCKECRFQRKEVG